MVMKTKKQIGALPVKWTKTGELRVLLVTTRRTRRWTPPKGWPMTGIKPWRAAEIEALEEAGVKGFIADESIGSFEYEKGLDEGRRVRCKVSLYPMLVHKEKKNWPERRERKRKWFSPAKAAKYVNEPELKHVLKSLDKYKQSSKKKQVFKLAS